MSEIRGLYLQFASFQRQTQKQIKALQKEVQELRETVASQERREQQKEPPKKQTDDTKKNVSTKSTPEVRVEPITYAEAFSRIGGAKALAKQAQRSLQLADTVNNANLQSELYKLFESYKNKRTGFSTNLINQKYVATLDELYLQAEAVLGGFSEMLYDLAGKCNNCKAVVGPLKSKMRARMKGAFKYRNPQNNTISWYRLTDLVRGTLEFNNIEDLYDGLEILIRRFGENVKELNDRYQKPLPGGYRDIQITVQFQGHMCEIQLNTRQMMQAKATTGHRNYAVYRELKSAVDAGDINRVLNAFEFGRDHLGGAVDGDEGERSGMEELLQGDAGTLIHTAATHGYAEILHAFLLYGADHNLQDDNGDTALHLATFYGHEACVWVLTHEGKADLDIKNNDGHTALVKGYLMMWQRPPEAKVRAVSTLAQVCGVKRIKEAKALADASIGSHLHQSRGLVDHAADGNVSKVSEKLREWADPMSKDVHGNSALQMAITNGHREVVGLLISYRAFPKTEEMCTAIKYNRESIWEILVDLCDVKSLDAGRLVKAAHESGLSFFREWLQRLTYQYDFDLSKFGLQPPFNGIFTMENAFPNLTGYISFTAERKLRAIYGEYEAMPLEFVPTGQPDIYKLYNRWPGENKWISLNENGKYLYANYSEAEAMPVKFFPTAVPNVYLMKDWTGGQENKWISFMNDGKWLRAIYDNEHDAMPVRLSFKTSEHSKHHFVNTSIYNGTNSSALLSESDIQEAIGGDTEGSTLSPMGSTSSRSLSARASEGRKLLSPVLSERRLVVDALSPSESNSERSTPATRGKPVVDPLSQSEQNPGSKVSPVPDRLIQSENNYGRRSGARRSGSRSERPVVDPLSLSEHNSAISRPASRRRRGADPLSVSEHGSQRRSAASSPRPRLMKQKSERRSRPGRRRKSSDDAPELTGSLGISDGQDRGRTKTSDDNDAKERVDRRLEWRSKSRSRRNLLGSSRSGRNLVEGASGEEKKPKPPRSRPELLRAESLNGKRLSQLNL